MKITTDLSSLATSLEIITRLAAPTSGNITFTSDGKKVKIVSSADVSRCITVLPCEVDKAGEFAVPLNALKDATKGRDKLEITFKNAVLHVACGKYSAELAAVDVIPLDDYEQEDGQNWKLTPDQSAWLRKSLKDIALKPTALLSSWMPAGIKLTGKGGFVTCFDTQHMSWTNSKEVTGDFECVLPIETITNVVDLFHKTPFTIVHCASRIEVKNKLTHVYLSIPSLDDLPSLADVQAKIKSAANVTGNTFTFNKSAIMTFMENARAVMSKERAEIVIEAKGKGINAEVRSTQGKVQATFPGYGKGRFKVDYEYMSEALAKAGEDLELNAVDDAYVSTKLNGLNLIIALNQ